MANYKFVDDTREALLKILEILKYPNDIEDFSNQLLELISVRTLDDLLKFLPQDMKDQLTQEIKTNVTTELINKLRETFPERDLQDKFIENFRKSIDEVLELVLKNATDEQKLQIEAIKLSVI